MGARFEYALAAVLRHEGGLADNPHDPGGVTQFGISMRFLKAVGLDPNRDGAVDRLDVLGLTPEAAAPIYREYFWNALRCNILPDGLDLAVFDSAVNQGQGAAAKMLQRAAGAKPDGQIGPNTIAAIRLKDPSDLLLDFMARRCLRYASTPKILIFGSTFWKKSQNPVLCLPNRFMTAPTLSGNLADGQMASMYARC